MSDFRLDRLDITVSIIRSNRRTLSIELANAELLVARAPTYMSQDEVLHFVVSNADWISKQRNKQIYREQYQIHVEPLPSEELDHMKEVASIVLPARVEDLSATVGVSCRRITVRKMRTRWGSYSPEGGMSLNTLLVACPPEVVDYVIIHELCHHRHMNHSAEFWHEVALYCPTYKEQLAWLKTEGNKLIERI